MQDGAEGRRCVGAPSFLGKETTAERLLVGVAVKWLWLGNKSQIDLDVFGRRYAAGLLMRTTR